ncbi:MAG: glycosyltransferase family 4 protein [Pseudomonadota bacterium]
MKILLTQRKLEGFGGTELITLELACALKGRGHDVCVYCPRPGKVCDLLASNRIATYSRIDAVPWRPDVIHGHHQLPATVALIAFADVPLVYACHGTRPWVEQAPLHPRIHAYVATSDKMAAYLATKQNIPSEQISIVPNYADTQRFSRVGTRDEDGARTALLFGQKFQSEEVKVLEEACEANGLSLDKIGAAYGNLKTNPELILPDYDVVFAIGRSAVEAMACGCAVIPITPRLAGHLVTHKTFDDWAGQNFSPRFFSGAERVTAAWLSNQLEAWNPKDIERLTAKVRSRYTLEAAVTQLEDLYKSAMDQPVEAEDTEALVAHLEKLAVEVDANWEAQQGLEYAQVRQRDMLQDQSAALRLAERQVEMLSRCILSAPGLVSSDAGAENWRHSIEQSGLFDREWYLATNPDVADQGMDPFLHYVTHGAQEGREPRPNCDEKDQARVNEAGLALMQHTALQLLTTAHTQAADRKPTSGANGNDLVKLWKAFFRPRHAGKG